MEKSNLLKLKDAILMRRELTVKLEACYKDFLNNFNLENTSVFSYLIELTEENERIREIKKVLDFIRFPIKYSHHN